MAQIYCYNKILMIFFWEEKTKTKRKHKEWSNLIFFKLSFLIYIKLNQQIHFLVHGHSSWSTFGSHLMRGPKAL